MKEIKNQISALIFSILIGGLSAGEPEPIQFAWLTDTHIGTSTATEDLRRAVADINSLDNIAFTIISGDIAELDIDGYLDTAKVILDQLETPYYIIPGNHDTKWSASGTRKFIDLWGDDKFNFEYENIRFIGIHQGPLLRMGNGYIVPEDLHWLDSVLTQLSDPSQKLLFITHYPIDSSVSNWYQFLDIIKQYNSQAILHGHGHANRAAVYEDVPGIMGRSTLRRNDPVGGYNIVSIWPDSAQFRERIPGQETLPTWHQLSIEDQEYDVTVEYDRPDFSSNSDYPEIKTSWKYNTGYAIASAPSIAGDYAIVTDGGGNITALDLESGSLVWAKQIGAPIYSTVALGHERVVFGATDSTIHCLSIHDGTPIWQVKTNAPVVASPAIHQGIVYCGGSDHLFRAIDLLTGRVIWEFKQVEGFVESIPLIHRKLVVFGAWDGNLYALNTSSGKLKWKWNDGRPGILYSPAVCTPVASGKKIYIVAPDRVMSCINARSGKTIWRSDRYQVRESIGISEDFKTIFAKTMWDTVVAYSARPLKNTLKWAVHAGHDYDIDPSAPVEFGGTVFYGTKDGYVFALNADTGSLRWRYRIGVGLVNNINPINANSILATSMDGIVTRIEENKPD